MYDVEKRNALIHGVPLKKAVTGFRAIWRTVPSMYSKQVSKMMKTVLPKATEAYFIYVSSAEIV